MCLIWLQNRDVLNEYYRCGAETHAYQLKSVFVLLYILALCERVVRPFSAIQKRRFFHCWLQIFSGGPKAAIIGLHLVCMVVSWAVRQVRGLTLQVGADHMTNRLSLVRKRASRTHPFSIPCPPVDVVQNTSRVAQLCSGCGVFCTLVCSADLWHLFTAVIQK